MVGMATNLKGVKEIPSVPGGSMDILPPAPMPVFVNPVSPKITPPVLNFKLPRPGLDRMNEDEGMDGDEGDVGDGTDNEDEVNLMDYVHKKSKKRVEPSMETVQLWGQYRKKTTDFRQDDWRTMGSLPNVNAYTDHPGAVMFKAP